MFPPHQHFSGGGGYGGRDCHSRGLNNQPSSSSSPSSRWSSSGGNTSLLPLAPPRRVSVAPPPPARKNPTGPSHKPVATIMPATPKIPSSPALLPLTPPPSSPPGIAPTPPKNPAPAPWPALRLPRLHDPPRASQPPHSLEALTTSSIAALVRRLSDMETITLPAVSHARFMHWQRSCADIYAPDAARRDLVLLQRCVDFRPRRGGDGGAEGLGDVIVKCMPSRYHDAVFETIAFHAKQAVGGDARGWAFATAAEAERVHPAISGFTPTQEFPGIEQSMVKIPDGAIFPPAPPPPPPRDTTAGSDDDLDDDDDADADPDTFPSVVVEVGFSEKLADLVLDATLFLKGTRGATNTVIVVELRELTASGLVFAPNDGLPAGDTAAAPPPYWPPRPAHGGPVTKRPPPPPPPYASAQERSTAVTRLMAWFLAVDGLPPGATQKWAPRPPPLVGAIDAWASIYRLPRRRDLSPSCDGGAHDDAAPADLHGDVQCCYRAQFIARDAPIDGPSLQLPMSDVLRIPPPPEGDDKMLTINLGLVANAIMDSRAKMVETRARQRAQLVVDTYETWLELGGITLAGVSAGAGSRRKKGQTFREAKRARKDQTEE
ncbi:hypothetical protein DFH27DRAFT_656398 [Peziza echinospora]|nr:hypothetical protein DFH27DRAFT_656398 [Peziza echinospora]